MREIFINNTTIEDTINELNVALDGNLVEKWGEYTLTFNNEFGEGVIRSIGFDWGLSLLDFDVNFKEVTKIIFKDRLLNLLVIPLTKFTAIRIQVKIINRYLVFPTTM